MSVSASIDINLLIEKLSGEYSVKIIKSFLNYGWCLDDEGAISFLPYGDGDNFEWTKLKIPTESIFDLVRKKQEKNEVVGVVVTWKNTGIGGSLLIYPDGAISFLAGINRKLLNNSIVTDVSWYLEKILPALSANGFAVESFVFSEHI